VDGGINAFPIFDCRLPIEIPTAASEPGFGLDLAKAMEQSKIGNQQLEVKNDLSLLWS
jgi:hypothetical protein